MEYPDQPEDQKKKKSSGGLSSWFKTIGTTINAAQTTITAYKTTKKAAK